MDNKEKNMQMFMYLIGSFEMSAMIAMGKIKNPMTSKTERDLQQAQFSIDILDMLKEKTAGNLDEYESKFLENVLGQLKLNYIDEARKDAADTKPEDKKPKGKQTEDNEAEDNQSVDNQPSENTPENK